MIHDDTLYFQKLSRAAFLGLLACSAIVTLCVLFVDRPTAFFVRDQRISHLEFLRWLTQIPMAFDALSALVVVLLAMRRVFGPFSRLEQTLFAAAVALMVAIALEWYLKGLFGRYWPGTWVQNNPSLLGSGAYGFHPFHFGEWYGSFPSGHTARSFSFLSVVVIAYPRCLWPALAICLAVVIGLVGMNYHFVGDTIGGAYLGAVTGVYSAAFAGIRWRNQVDFVEPR